LISRSSSKPSVSGMFTSVITRWYCLRSRALTASAKPDAPAAS